MTNFPSKKRKPDSSSLWFLINQDIGNLSVTAVKAKKKKNQISPSGTTQPILWFFINKTTPKLQLKYKKRIKVEHGKALLSSSTTARALSSSSGFLSGGGGGTAGFSSATSFRASADSGSAAGAGGGGGGSDEPPVSTFLGFSAIGNGQIFLAITVKVSKRVSKGMRI